MKRNILLLLLVVIMGMIISCDEGPTAVKVVDDNSSDVYNYDITGKTLVSTVVDFSNTKTVTVTDASGNETVDTYTIPVREIVRTYTFSEKVGGEGTFTFTKIVRYLSAIDDTYDNTAEDTATQDVDYALTGDYAGYANQICYQVSAEGTYTIRQQFNKRDVYDLTILEATFTEYSADGSTLYVSSPPLPAVDYSASVKTTESITFSGEGSINIPSCQITPSIIYENTDEEIVSGISYEIDDNWTSGFAIDYPGFVYYNNDYIVQE